MEGTVVMTITPSLLGAATLSGSDSLASVCINLQSLSAGALNCLRTMIGEDVFYSGVAAGVKPMALNAQTASLTQVHAAGAPASNFAVTKTAETKLSA